MPIRAKKNRYIKKAAFSILVHFNLKRSQMRIFFQELFTLWQFTSKKFKLFTSYIILCVSVELNHCVLSLQIKIVYGWLIYDYQRAVKPYLADHFLSEMVPFRLLWVNVSLWVIIISQVAIIYSQALMLFVSYKAMKK